MNTPMARSHTAGFIVDPVYPVCLHEQTGCSVGDSHLGRMRGGEASFEASAPSSL